MLDSGATANLVGIRWFGRHNRLLKRHGFQRVSANPSKARFISADGRVGDIRHAAGTPAGIAGNKGKLTAFLLGADIPARFRKGATAALGGATGFPARFVGFS